jgi:perosamine synthetase
MLEKFIPQMEPWFAEEEKKAVCDYMNNCGFITEFKNTQRFEEMIGEYTKAKHVIVVNNGTISLTLAAMAAGIKTNDEVIVPNYTMIASPNSVKMFGAEPVFVDVEPTTLCLDIGLVRKAITKKTKAIMLVAANGRYPEAGIKSFEDLAKEYNLILLEDAAQALGSFYPDGRHIGLVGDIGSLSFSAPKIISTGQGGALLTNNDDLAHKLRRLKDFGRSTGGNDIHDTIGYNFKFTELQACIGIEQMKKLSWRVSRKKEIYQEYKKYLSGLEQVNLFNQDTTYTSPWFIDTLVEDRAGLQEHLKKNNVGTRLMYPPINKQKAYQVPGEHKVSNLVGEKGLWLPSAVQLTNSEIENICNEIKKYYV